ncbi:MAG: hypothetical protein ACKVT2_00360, partial [Saprospiraceae bacterium]
MKIFTLNLFCSFTFLSTALFANPNFSIFSRPDDSLFSEILVKTEVCDKGPSPALDTMTVSKSASLPPTVVVTGDFCGNGSGSIDLTPDSNTPGPWTFLWSTGATTEDLSGLLAGTYVVNITDANGNVQIEQIVVPDLPPVTPAGANCTFNGNTNCISPFNGSLDLTVIPLL